MEFGNERQITKITTETQLLRCYIVTTLREMKPCQGYVNIFLNLDKVELAATTITTLLHC